MCHLELSARGSNQSVSDHCLCVSCRSNFGTIALDEFFEYIGEQSSPIVDRLYVQLIGMLWSPDNSLRLSCQLVNTCARHSPPESQTKDARDLKLLTFENFVLFVLVFCMLSEADILKCELALHTDNLLQESQEKRDDWLSVCVHVLQLSLIRLTWTAAGTWSR